MRWPNNSSIHPSLDLGWFCAFYTDDQTFADPLWAQHQLKCVVYPFKIDLAVILADFGQVVAQLLE